MSRFQRDIGRRHLRRDESQFLFIASELVERSNVALENRDGRSVGGVPQASGVVFRRRRKPNSVGSNSDISHRRPVVHVSNQRTGPQIPLTYGPVETASDSLRKGTGQRVR